MTAKIVRSVEPEVLECPFEEVALSTPNDLYYVRNHFPPLDIAVANWSLSVEGSVAKPLQLSYDDIISMAATSGVMTMECAGNSRTFLVPPVKGVQWELGGVSTATWTGVPLAAVLEKAGVKKEEAVAVIFEGGDKGVPEQDPKPAGPIHYARSLPMSKALDPRVMLAYLMNGEKLSRAHGFPLRLIVPGWYAMASVKWLTRIIVSDKQFNGYFETIDYGYWDRSEGEPARKPISEMLVKSQVARPQLGESLPVGCDYLITGAAWSGAAKIKQVEVSTDGGVTWDMADIDGERQSGVWCLWRYSWKTPVQPGESVVLSRATDENGNVQPEAHDLDRATYMINFCLPIRVKVG